MKPAEMLKKHKILKTCFHLLYRFSYKNQKNAWMDSEIFRGRFLDMFSHCLTFTAIRPPIGPVYVG
jgi:hypothetical protein